MSEAHPEIVIIRRNHGGDHDEHHGGVWKIAFADFMTAMMAFFLVMWLISANDKTRASVARYFNPVRLVDATTQPRGLHDTKKDESGITASPDNKKADDKKEKPGTAGPDKSAPASETTKAPESASAKDKRLDKALRDEPFVALAEIASGKPPHATKPAASAPSNNGPGRGGEAYRDPFAPPPASASADKAETDALGSTDAALLPAPEDDHRSGSGTDKANADRSEPGKPAAQSAALKAAEGKASTLDPMSPVNKTGTAAAAPIAKTKAATETAEKLTKLAANLQKEANATGPAMTISQTPEGVLLSLTDRGNFSMFSNGSAVPSKRLVLLMADVGKLLKNRPGAIVVRGYTDNKQFRSRRYDNWNLSLDRAQVAHYMLMRGGLPDARFDHVEGYADHAGKAELDPGDPLNRRIDILIRDAS